MEKFLSYLSDFGAGAVFIALAAYLVYQIVQARIDTKKKADESRIRRQEELERQDREDKREQLRDDREHERMEREDARYSNLSESINKLVDTMPQKIVHTKEEQDEDMNVVTIIQRELDELTQLEADRAYFFSFHNGGVDVLGRGMLKMSMLAESSKDMTYNMMDWQSVPRSLMPVLYSNLARDGYYEIKAIEDIAKTDIKLFCVLKNNNACSAMFRAIKDANDLIVGFIGAEFNHPCSDFKKMRRMVAQRADRISGVLIGSPLNNE